MSNFLPKTAVPFTNAYIVDVTPELAKEWITLGPTDRTISAPRIQKLSDRMKAGLWHQSHEGIAFDENGNLIDGLHRLHAVALGGMTVPMLVIVDEPVENAAVIDNRNIG